MLVVAIIGTLAGIAIPSVLAAAYRAQVARAIGDIKSIETEIDAYEIEHGRLPLSLNELGRADLTDPWGNPYQYLSFASAGRNWKGKARKDHALVPLNSTYDLYSIGRDGKSASPLTARASQDDIVRANDGGFVGLGSSF